jgi:hypothetical protein
MLGALCELHNETECAIMQRLFHMGNVNAKGGEGLSSVKLFEHIFYYEIY